MARGWRVCRKIRSRCFWRTVVVVWPAALFRLSFLKAYAVMVYLTGNQRIPWGTASFHRNLAQPLPAFTRSNGC